MTKILLIITGGIASYKSLDIIRTLKRRGYTVYPLMTSAACAFITPLSVSTLAGNPVAMDMFSAKDTAKIDHIHLSRQVDSICIAPCSANCMAKIAHGIADDLATTTVLGSTAPLLIAPAMNPAMWNNPATQANVAILKKRNITILEPTAGETACGEVGVGRMCDPEYICHHIETMRSRRAQTASPTLAGKRYLVTVGATVEYIDPVRVITNRSSGKQGFAIARALLAQGAQVTLVVGSVQLPYPQGAEIQKVDTAEEMLTACKSCLPVDGAIFCAAVADYKVVNGKGQKHKKCQGPFTIELQANPDILSQIARQPKRPKIVIGFAAETENVVENATKKLHEKTCDMIVANRVDKHSFGADTTDAYMVEKEKTTRLGTVQKTEVASAIVQYIQNKSHLL